MVSVEFNRIRQAVGVGVLVAVTHAIPICVRNQRAGSNNPDFIAIAQSVLVGVPFQGVGFQVYFVVII